MEKNRGGRDSNFSFCFQTKMPLFLFLRLSQRNLYRETFSKPSVLLLAIPMEMDFRVDDFLQHFPLGVLQTLLMGVLMFVFPLFLGRSPWLDYSIMLMCMT